MQHTIKNEKVRAVLLNPDLDAAQRINLLTKMREDARAEQRAASESMMVDADGLNADLRDIELALDGLGQSPAEVEGKGPASL